MKDIILQQPADWDCAVTLPDQLFNDDAFCAQEKIDGCKVVIFSDNGDLRGEFRSGRNAPLSAKTRAMMPTHGTFIVEGEQGNRLTGDTGFVAFDVIMVNGEDVRHLPYDERLDVLATLGVPMIETFYGTTAKRRLHEALKEKGAEGLVFKRLDAKYRPGKTSAQLKLVFKKRDSFRVVGCDGKGVELQTLDGFPAGRCAGFVQVGKIVDVQFMQWTDAGKLRSPVLVGVREDLE